MAGLLGHACLKEMESEGLPTLFGLCSPSSWQAGHSTDMENVKKDNTDNVFELKITVDAQHNNAALMM